MDKQLADRISKRTKELLGPLAEEFGFSVALRGGSYTPTGNLLIKVEFSQVNDDGITMTREASRLVQSGALYGLPDDSLGKPFDSAGESFILIGMTQRSAKWPFLAKNTADGKTYRMTKNAVLAGFGIEVGA